MAKQPTRIGEILPDLLPEDDKLLDQIEAAFRDELPKTVMENITLLGVRRGVLRIQVHSACLLHELRSFQYEELLRLAQKASNTISVQKVALSMTRSS